MIDQIAAKVERLRQRSVRRDSRMRDVLRVRQGDISGVFPGAFSDDYPKPLIANFIDVAARDLAEAMAPLPAFNCSATNISSDTQRKAADIRTRIANFYVSNSDLQLQMYKGADWYNTFGLLPAIIELDYDDMAPRIRLLNPWGVYPEIDRFGRTISLSQKMSMSAEELSALYPEFRGSIMRDGTRPDTQLDIIKYHDKDIDLLYIPSKKNLVLSLAANPVGRCLARVAERPSIDGENRGQFDDVLAVQLARARFAILQIQAAEKSVQAPISVPQDVQEIALGPDSILRSNNPQAIRRVSLELPNGVFAESAQLERELRQGSRYPETRSGNIDASVVTGRGVQALQAGFDTQIKSAQATFARLFADMVSLAFEVDEKLFGANEKTIKGSDDGTPYVLKYRPSKDIKGDYTVDVQYGLMSGLDPNRALIFGLQARSDKLISRDFLRRNLPFNVNVTQEEQRIDIEEMRDALRQAVASSAIAIPQMAAQGQDPSNLIRAIAQVVTGRQKGEALESVVTKAFQPEPQPEVPAAGVAPGSAPAAPTQGGPVAAPAAGPGGTPDLGSLLAAIGA